MHILQLIGCAMGKLSINWAYLNESHIRHIREAWLPTENEMNLKSL